jgi:hypothetical protein
MKDANIAAFEFLIDQLTENSSLTVKNGARYIKTDSDEKKWLKELKIKSVFQPLPDVKAIQIDFEDKKYLALINANASNHSLDKDVIQENSLNAGLLTVLLSEKLVELDLKIEFLDFYNEVMFQHLDPDYKGHDFNDLIRYIQPINFYSLPENSVLESQGLKRILSYVYSKNPDRLINNFEDSVLSTFAELSLMGSNNISFGLVLSSLLSNSFKHTFLELYRLVERIFPVSYLKDFHEVSKSNLSFIEFSSNLESITSWRPKEDEALNKIFELTEASTKRYFDTFFNSSNEFKSQAQYKFFYKLRNSIVHFRTAHDSINLTDSQWNKLIHATLYLLDEHYSKYHKILEIK